MNLLTKIGLTILLLGVAFGVGRYTAPSNKTNTNETNTTTETRVIEREITRPDGTKEKEKVTENIKETEKKSTTIVENKKPDWKANLLGGYSFTEKKIVYGASIEKRYLGPISLGVWGNTQNTYGVSIGLEF